MPIDYEKVMQIKKEGVRFSYTDRDVLLYALGVGFGRDPLNEKELPYVYEESLKTVPTMATVITINAAPITETGVNFMMLVHGEQGIKLHRPLPQEAEVLANTRVAGAYDKGKDKGALVCFETAMTLESGEPLCTLSSTVFARGDGGFGGPRDGAPQPHPLPERVPDMQCEVTTREDQALLYRLCGDRNPLHADPAIAEQAGFPKPILHGLCTYGSACRGILRDVCGYDHTLIQEFNARFSAPVFPGETLVLSLWRDETVVSFRAAVKEREGVIVLNNGKCVLTKVPS